jgi:hypothetical protein
MHEQETPQELILNNSNIKNITKYKNIYIFCPGAYATGGIEALFQLSDAINNLYGNCITIFNNEGRSGDTIPARYHKYNIVQGTTVEDSADNLVIVPEVWPELLQNYNKINKAIWWLSASNWNCQRFTNYQDTEIMHFYQSYYALMFLIHRGAYRRLPLFEYISYSNPIIDITKKQNIVCYNPTKGGNITAKLIELNPDISFVPITNRSHEQIAELLSVSKVYIDFGHHPGRDRIPREAALFKNCIITNYSGSANYYEDVPIMSKYKFRDNLHDVGTVIRDCFNNFNQNIANFEMYVSIIKNEKELMYAQLKQIFGIPNT